MNHLMIDSNRIAFPFGKQDTKNVDGKKVLADGNKSVIYYFHFIDSYSSYRWYKFIKFAIQSFRLARNDCTI